jgi:hypothetical protein
MISINQTINLDVTVNSDAYVQFEQITNSYDIDCNTVNRNKNKYNGSSTSQLVCENGWGGGFGGK